MTPQTYGTLPGMETREFQFQPGELRVQAGQPVALRLLNHDRAPHSFDVDELDVHAPMTSGEPGLVVFTAPPPRQLPLLLRRPRPRGQGVPTGGW